MKPINLALLLAFFGASAASPATLLQRSSGGERTPNCTCDPTKPFGTPTLVPNIGSPLSVDAGADLPDDRTLYFNSQREGGRGQWDLYVATRDSAASLFTNPQPLGFNSPGAEFWPRLTRDQLTMFYTFADPYPGDILVTSRSSMTAAFAPGVPVSGVNSTDGDEGDPFLWMDGQIMYLVSNRPGGAGEYDLYQSIRRADGSYGSLQAISELNTAVFDSHPVVTSDGLTIYWGSNRTDGETPGGFDVWMATRSSTSERFGHLSRVPELNSEFTEYPTWISPDGCRIYLSTERPTNEAQSPLEDGGRIWGSSRIWEAVKPPL